MCADKLPICYQTTSFLLAQILGHGLGRIVNLGFDILLGLLIGFLDHETHIDLYHLPAFFRFNVLSGSAIGFSQLGALA